ncbi:MAG: hypothetical protein A3E01_08265 [Gammaproteobacteria bacterium RIFCSPHIGHO2_12_FULL_63_22]|nr:MAG: hypothetical protein A3E01_08265 [Gammaproteobacteria bacterium RIFCSPHIGHO2_12_FULL_63_22]
MALNTDPNIQAGGSVAPSTIAEGMVEPSFEDTEAQRLKDEADMARLEALGQSLAKTRSSAIAARLNSGVEDEWLEDEEFYQGIDDSNRSEHKSFWRSKPPGQATATPAAATRSTVFPNITRPYVDAAAARIADMLLPTDDRSWAISPTPVPDVEDVSNGKFPQPVIEQAAGANPGNPEGAKRTLAIATQAALEVMADAKAKAEKAQTRIEDWHIECQWHAHVRTVIEDSARIGTGVLKGPMPERKDRTVWRKNSITMVSETKPVSKWIDPWNFYPDGACGENIHNGSYTWERDYITKSQLRKLKGQQGYIDSQIDLCLVEGPQTATAEYKPTPDAVADDRMRERYEIWYYHGVAEKEDLEAAGVNVDGEDQDPHLPVMLVMVNNRVIKAALNPLDTGEFPYDVMVWQKRAGSWTGIGVARQIRTPQRIVTAASRNLMDNAGIAAGPMLVFRQGVITPADGKAPSIAPRRLWYIHKDAEEYADATKAIGVIKVDMMVDDLLKIIQLGLKLAEDVTGLPALLQGQMGKAPDTLGGMQMLSNNASAVLRRLARLFDDRVTEPHVRRYYHFLLQYGEDSEKGDYCIDARGSSALVERDLQNQAVAQMASIAQNPVFGLDPKRWAQEFLKSQRLDAKRFEFDDEEWKQIVQNMSKGAQDPRLAIAQLRAQVEVKLQELDQGWKSMEAEKQRQVEEHGQERDRQLDYIIAEMEQMSGKDISLNTLKGKLADTVIKVRAQRDLSKRDDNIAGKPPTEPAGRAQPGQAYQH